MYSIFLNIDTLMKMILHIDDTITRRSQQNTPFEAMFGRIGRLPIDINHDCLKNPDAKLDDYHKRDDPDTEQKKA